MKLSQLRKEAAQAPKFVLKIDGLDLYLSNKQALSGCNLTKNIKEAMTFAHGFDNKEMKLGIWNAAIKRQMNNVSFKIINL